MQPTAREIEKQQRREIDDIRRGEKAYYEAMAARDPSALPSGKRLMREVIPALTAAIEAHQASLTEAEGRPGRKATYHWHLQMVRPLTLALLTVDSCLRAEMPMDGLKEGTGSNLQAIGLHLAATIKMHCEVAELAESSGRDVMAELKKRHGAANTQTWRRWRTNLGAAALNWNKELRLTLGCALIRMLVDTAPSHFSIVTPMISGRVQAVLTLSPVTAAVMADVEQRRAIALPHYMPMTMRPLDWRYEPHQLIRHLGENASTAPKTGGLTGGYVIHKLPLIRTGRDDHTGALASAVSVADLEAVNRIQGTAWAINRWIYDVAAEAWLNGQRIKWLEPGEMMPHTSMRDADYAGLTEEARKAYLAGKRKVHEENAKRRSKFNAAVDILAVARELYDEPAIWFPCVKDFRHRVYPVPVRGPNPQGNDLSKSMIHFAEGKALGDVGLFWLAVHTANCAGQDKLSLEERVAWAYDNADLIGRCAKQPLTEQAWMSLEKPWAFLAASNELSRAWSLEDPSTFISHLPVAMDGTCNGIQHLSAMGLDLIGAQATNLQPGERQDVYVRVAEVVAARVAQDAAQGVPSAQAWLGKVERKTVKRGVMTTPYGVTPRGIRTQLLDGELVPDGDKQGELADYMRDRIHEGLRDTVVSAKEIMDWLQGCARVLSKAGLPLRWDTPSGSAVEQAYHQTAVTKIATLCGELTLLSEDAKSTIKPQKQASGAAPNVVHSFDAAHLAMTVVAGAERGIGSWAMIHDSFGTHAANTQALSGVLREQFVAIYSQDWLTRLYDGFKAYAPHVQLPTPPARGNFDIGEVLYADFFFS